MLPTALCSHNSTAQKSPVPSVVWTFIMATVFQAIPLYALAKAPRTFVITTVTDGSQESAQLSKRLDGSLREYLKRSVRVDLVDGKAKRRGSADAVLMEAEATKVSAIDLFNEGKNEEALEGFIAAIKGFQKSVASIRDIKSVYQALYYAGAVSLALEYDGDAKDFFRQLAAIAPEGDFEVTVPEKAKKKYLKERRKLLKKKRGGLTIESTPPGGEVRINGEVRCQTPCEVVDLPRGKHYLSVEKAGVGKTGRVVKVKTGRSSVIRLELAPDKKVKPSAPVTDQMLAALKLSLDKAQVDGQLKEMLDQIGDEQEVTYEVLNYLIVNRRKAHLFTFVYHVNEKRIIATEAFKFKANFSATRITAMKLVKAIEELVQHFPDDAGIDGVYPPLAAALDEVKSKPAPVVAVVKPPTSASPPATPPATPPTQVQPKPEPKTQPKATQVEPSQSKVTVPSPALTQKTPADLSAPPKDKVLTAPLLPPPSTSQASEDDSSIISSPWFWAGVSVAVVGGVTTGALLLMDDSSDAQRYQSRVVW